jgi:hypothetical protein
MGKVLYPSFRLKNVKCPHRAKTRALMLIVNQQAFDRLMERVGERGYRSADHLILEVLERELGLPEGGAEPFSKGAM